MNTKKITTTMIVLLLFSLTTALQASGLKSVLVLDFANVEAKTEYQYLQTSIANAVKKSLKKKFAFKQTERDAWEEVAAANFLYEDELHTKSAAMNLGLLSKQDVVISGSFTIRKNSTAGSASDTLITQVRLIDIPRKKIISETKYESPLNTKVFIEVEKMAAQIAEAAKAVLPTKEQWSKTGISEVNQPFFDRPVLGLRLGGALYASGYADRFQSSQPSLGATFRMRMPRIWNALMFAGNINFVRHSWDRNFNAVTETSDIETSNFLGGVYFGIDVKLSRKFSVMPKLGGGYVLQDTQITGEVNQSTGNLFPFAGAGVEIAYRTSSNIALVFDLTGAAEIEGSTVTFLNTAQLGINFHL